MEFCLVYQGPLTSSGNSTRHAAEKHLIRKQIHKQLAALWDIHPLLKGLRGPWGDRAGKPFVEYWSKSMFGFDFLPLVNERLDQVCALNILLLRRERPGGLITQGGDIDNRVKTLFDALSVPKSDSGLVPPEPTEKPFYCLMEEDKLCTEVKVTAERLLTPPEGIEPQSFVYAVIGVKIQVAMAFQWGGLTHHKNY